jgi:hypothetical protein
MGPQVHIAAFEVLIEFTGNVVLSVFKEFILLNG